MLSDKAEKRGRVSDLGVLHPVNHYGYIRAREGEREREKEKYKSIIIIT